MKFKVVDITGKQFDRLKVLGLSRVDGEARWNCVCSCGIEVEIRGYDLRSGHTTSCGCVQKEMTSKARRTHGYSGRNRTYSVWASMKQRCQIKDKKRPDYKIYGGKGIKVCERWQRFENFLEDMGECPPGLSIDRENNALGYEPGNCRWATTEQQANNKKTVPLYEFNGRTLSLSQWSRETGHKTGTLWKRISMGWSIQRALTEPSEQRTLRTL